MPAVIITGSSSGIGRAAATLFAKHGWQLVLNGRKEANLKETVKDCVSAGARGSDVAYVVGDVTNHDTLEKLVKTAVDKFGRLDCLVNNAGFGVPMAPLVDAPIENYDRVFATNVRSVIEMTKLAIPHIIKTKGTIVNISSVVSMTSSPGAGYYSMSKSALDQFTQILSIEMAPHGVRVNSVNPGMIDTNFLANMGTRKEDEPMYKEYAKKVHALGRTGTVQECANAIFWLAGPESTFTTGQLLKVDGGYVLVRP